MIWFALSGMSLLSPFHGRHYQCGRTGMPFPIFVRAKQPACMKVSRAATPLEGDDMKALPVETDRSQPGSHEKKQDSLLGWIFRIGAVAAVFGSLLAMVGNLIHPATTGLSPNGVAHVIVGSGAWTTIHLIIVVGLIFMLGGLLAICRSIKGGLAGTLARVGGIYVI